MAGIIAVVVIFIIVPILAMLGFRADSIDAPGENIKISYKRLYSLYCIAPDRFETVDPWCIQYTARKNNQTFFIYPPFPFGTLRLQFLNHRINKAEQMQYDNESMKDFLACMQCEIDKFKEGA